MEKIKNVLSHGQSKESDAAQGRHDTPTAAEFDRSKTGGLTGEGSHLTGAHQSTQGASGEYHPIYDQFAKGDTPGDSKTTGDAPHFSNTPHVPQATSTSAGDSSAPSATPSLHPNQYRPGPHEDTSTASIKSGVIGFPQGSSDTHAARPNDNLFEQKQREAIGSNQPGAGGDLSGTRARDHESHLGQGAAAGTGALGAGALAEHASRSHPEDPSYSSARQPPHINLQRQESDIPPDSGRSFPLAGGVAHQASQTAKTTNEREPGTKEREAGLHDGQSRQGLAGAAEAASASSVIPQNEGRIEANLQPHSVEQPVPEHHHGRDAAVAGGLGAAGVGAHEAAKRHEAQPSQLTNPSQSANPEALAAARAAVDEHGWTHDHAGHGHKYEGDPCDSTPASPQDGKNSLLFTSGPHSTDTANRIDPKLHIPGGFPSPTPLEESNAPSYIQSKPTTETTPSAFAAEPGLRHTGSLDEPQARSAEQPTSEHHYGRDAAIAGGLGAAGAGAYAAGKHHQTGSSDVGDKSLYNEPNPYTHTKVDPRVDTVPRGGFAEQRYDPVASENRDTRNAALTGGAIGSSQPSTQPSTEQASKGRELSNKEYPLAGQDVNPDSQHHYGRDAALVGAGAATTAGLYASQRDAEPDSGPASSTVGPHKSNVVNVLDPRVQPDPAVQKHHHAAPTVEDPAPSTVGPHKSDVANVMDPRVLPDPQKQKGLSKEEASRLDPKAPEEASKQHHYGRDAAVAGGAGAAGYGAYEAAKSYGEHPSTQPGASMDDQRYDPSVHGAHDPRSTAGTSTSATSPHDQQHHYGRDAAAVGGLGAAGAGMHAANRDHQLEHQRAVPGGLMILLLLLSKPELPRLSTTTVVTPPLSVELEPWVPERMLPLAGMIKPNTPSATQGYQQSSTARGPTAGVSPLDNQRYDPATSTQQASAPQSQHHYGRDAAAVGGAGALGAGAYAATRGHDDHQQNPTSGTHGLDSQRYDPTTSAPQSGMLQDASTQQAGAPQSQHHYGRDAAVVGGAGALGAGAYAATRDRSHPQAQQPSVTQGYQPQDATQVPRPQDPKEDHTKRNAALGTAAGVGAAGAGAYGLSQHDAQKEQERQLKEQQKAFDDQQKASSRRRRRNTPRRRSIKEKEHAKEMEKQQKEHDKLLAAKEKEAQKEREATPEEEGSPKEKKHRFLTFLNKKDKDRTGDSDENSPRASRDSPRHSKEYAAGAAGVGAAGAGAAAYEHEEGRHLAEKKGRNVLHKEPPVGHPAREADPHVGKREHIGIDGPIGDPNLVSGDQQTKPGVYGAHPASDVAGGHHTVTEPHTGLPTNVEKYGDGRGGTDASGTVPGVHEGSGQGSATDWDAIKKGDTVY
ncbi:uncharacterized protein N0V89_000534 [Didymosphaeria variabile]|uniref:Uncharacterized protein n=1 Tax=Didymosphaeria variabile TaxID=1932322 RepID=A0A9W9CFY4_9PLEO|nr:uncharacterized protein N0V89_000534 [Didymosphaeria variabile]KAJ4359975.1 hypothetical protein N0V89_000534 [Didymosphaeria variabile]